MEFYQSVFGGELNIATFAEYQASEDPGEQNKVMHAALEGANGIIFMGADTPNSMEYEAPAGISLSLSGDDEKTLRGYWDKLSTGGSVRMPLEAAPWGDTFGMCVDKFGISWMVNIAGS
jgi:PhnB protein